MSGIFAATAILGIGWQFGSAAASSFLAADAAASGTTTTSSGSSTTGSSSGGTTTSATATPTPTASASASTPAASGASGTYTGSVESTPFGTVQVEIVVSSGKITDVKALKLTDQGGRSVDISNRAAPILRQQVIAAQSANVNGVSGATYTTEGYLSSVQSAIDKARL